MRVIAKRTLRIYWIKHNECKEQLRSWYHEAEAAIWAKPSDIIRDYPMASILQNNRVCFNIKGNKYRLIIRINYKYRIVWIRFIGTHAEYDKIDANKI